MNYEDQSVAPHRTNSSETTRSRLGRTAFIISLVMCLLLAGVIVVRSLGWESWPYNLVAVMLGSLTGLGLGTAELARPQASPSLSGHAIAAIVINGILIIASVCLWLW